MSRRSSSHTETPVPPGFALRLSRALGEEEASALLASLAQQPVRALRANPHKVHLEQLARRLGIVVDPVPWCADATYLPADLRLGHTVEHRAGLFYLQEPSAMSVVEALDIEPHHHVLDVAAAPGGKSTQAAAMLGEDGFLLANEVVSARVGPLLANLDAWGYPNVSVASAGVDRLADAVAGMFDRVILDAPCSGEALFRRDPANRAQWSEAHVRGAARRQRKLLAAAARAVRPGGLLAYSTCTFGSEENEDQVTGFLADHSKWTLAAPPIWPDVDVVALAEPGSGGVAGNVLRFYPHHCRCEGQFVAILRAPADDPPRPAAQRRRRARPAPLNPAWEAFATATLRRELDPMRIIQRGETFFLAPPHVDLPAAAAMRPGLPLGRLAGVTFRPAHALAMTLRAGDVAAHLELDGNDVEAFRAGGRLRRPGPSGWLLVTVDGWPIGWGQRSGNEIIPRLPGHVRARR